MHIDYQRIGPVQVGLSQMFLVGHIEHVSFVSVFPEGEERKRRRVPGKETSFNPIHPWLGLGA